MNDINFAEWMQKQMRMAGEELIRWSELMNFEGWEGVKDISIDISIPTYKESLEASMFKITFNCYNKVAIADLIANCE